MTAEKLREKKPSRRPTRAKKDIHRDRKAKRGEGMIDLNSALSPWLTFVFDCFSATVIRGKAI